jgi:cathepsin L
MRVLVGLASLLALCAVALAMRSESMHDVARYTYDEYVRDFGKHYASQAEYHAHKKLFHKRVAEVIAHNRRTDVTWKKAVNKFTDMTESEQQRYRGHSVALARKLRATFESVDNMFDGYDVNDLPPSVDWRNNNPRIVSDVKDQGSCGSCWAFATTEIVESAVAQATGTLLTLSPQNIVDCAPNPHHCGGTGGCEGSIPELGMTYVQQSGQSLDSDYPYVAHDQPCVASTTPKAATIPGFVKLAENNYTQLMSAVATMGPVAINVAAGSWGSYGAGVYTCQQSETDIDHVVQLVGYGTDPTQGDYWLVRNSWGPGWGEAGYIRVQRHSDGDMTKWCAVDTRPSDGTGCDGGPSQVNVCGSCGIWYDASYPTGGSLVPHKRA